MKGFPVLGGTNINNRQCGVCKNSPSGVVSDTYMHTLLFRT